MPRISEKEQLEAIADEVFTQAEQGLAVPVDQDVADALGAFEETAISDEDLDELDNELDGEAHG